MSNTPFISPQTSAKFIVFDGPDGCGKSTQLQKSAEYVAEQLSDAAGVIPPLTLRSPGGSELAEVIRAQVLTREGLPNDVRLHSMLLSMLSTTLELVQPAIQSGRWVLMDRYLLSTLIYQGLLAGNSIYRIKESIDAVFKSVNIKPDAYLVYNVSADTSIQRISARNEQRTVFEHENLVRRMNPAYQFAKSLVEEPVFYIDGEGSVDEVWRRTQSKLAPLLPL